MKLISRLLMAFGVIGVLLCIFLLVGCVLYSLPPPLKDQMKLVSVSAEAVKSYDKKIDAFKLDAEKAALAKETKEVSFTITEEEINSKLIEILAEGDLPIKEAFVNFTDNRIWVYTELTVVAIPTKVVMIGDASILKNQLQSNVDTLQLGRLPLPSSTIEKISSLINVLIKMDSPFDNLPIKITSIGINGKAFTLKGLTIPKS